jgi:hypothetical protein
VHYVLQTPFFELHLPLQQSALPFGHGSWNVLQLGGGDVGVHVHVFQSALPHFRSPLPTAHRSSEQPTSTPQQNRKLFLPRCLPLQSFAQLLQSSPMPGEQMPSPHVPTTFSLQSSKQLSHVSPPSTSHTPSMTHGLQPSVCVLVHELDPGSAHMSAVHLLPSSQSATTKQQPGTDSTTHVLATHTATWQSLVGWPEKFWVKNRLRIVIFQYPNTFFCGVNLEGAMAVHRSGRVSE